MKALTGIVVVVASACSSGNDVDMADMERQAVAREYGIEPAEMVDLQDGSRIMFFGDSITVGGQDQNGYVTLVADALEGLYPDRQLDVLASGVVGDKVSDLGDRLQPDVLSRKPTHVVIYVGVNDVASLGSGSAALASGETAYRRGLADLITRIRATGAWVMICTPSLLGEDVDEESAANRRLERFATAAREVAAEHQAGLCDLRREFTEYLQARNLEGRDRGILTVDGIHLNPAGHRIVAGAMLRELVTTAAPSPDLAESSGTGFDLSDAGP